MPKKTSHRLAKSSAPPAKATQIKDDEVARLAYQFWEERNFAHGFAEEDWHRAVKTLSASN
jgi:hypothetical protein